MIESEAYSEFSETPMKVESFPKIVNSFNKIIIIITLFYFGKIIQK